MSLRSTRDLSLNANIAIANRSKKLRRAMSSESNNNTTTEHSNITEVGNSYTPTEGCGIGCDILPNLKKEFEEKRISPLDDLKEEDDTDKIASKAIEGYIKHYDVIGNRYESFEIMNYLYQYMTRTLHVNSEQNATHNRQQVVAKALQKVFVSNNVPIKGRKDIIIAMRELFPDVGIPTFDMIYEKGRKDGFSRYNEIQHILQFDCCINNCSVFVGSKEEQLVKCLDCSTDRYTRICEECPPGTYLKRTYNCNHQRTKPIAKKILQYRPISSIVKSFLTYENFNMLLKYKDEDYRVGTYHDAFSGLNMIEQTDEMKTIFKMYRKECKDIEFRKQIKPMNLSISIGFDGAKFFNWKTHKVWPLYIKFENFPPSLRKKLGIGLHCISVFVDMVTTDKEFSKRKRKKNKKNMAKNKKNNVVVATQTDFDEDTVQQFLLRKLLVAELIHLERGLLMFDYADQPYLVQVRVINHMYDTPALSSMMKVQFSGSYAGCPFCKTIRGNFKKVAGSVLYRSHVCTLPLDHPFRRRAQSQNLLPVGYFSKAYNHSREKRPFYVHKFEGKPIEPQYIFASEKAKIINNLQVYTDDTVDITKQQYDEPEENKHKMFDKDGYPTKSGLSTIIKPMLHNMSHQPYFYSLDVCHPNDFIQHSYQQHFDFRQQKEYVRTTHQEYITNAIRYAENNGINVVGEVNGQKQKRTKKVPENGTQGMTEFALLKYFSFEHHINPDPFHVLENIAKYSMQILNGTVIGKYSDRSISYCRHYAMHPSAINGSPDWMLLEVEIMYVESFVESMFIPKGYSNDFKLSRIFTNASALNGMNKIFIITSLMELIITAIGIADRTRRDPYPIAYISYWRMLSDIFKRIQASQFTEEDILDLHTRIKEYLSIHEQLFPHVMCKIVYHQLYDLPPYIRRMGPLRNSWTLPVERALSQFKRVSRKSGRKFYKNALEANIEKELITQDTFMCSLKDDNFKKYIHYDDSTLMIDNNGLSNNNSAATLIYSNYHTAGLSRKRSKYNDKINFRDFNIYQREKLLLAMLEVICIKINKVAERRRNSAVFRMWEYYEYERAINIKKRNRSFVDIDFAQYIELLANYNENIVELKSFTTCQNLDDYVTDSSNGYNVFYLSDIEHATELMGQVSFVILHQALINGTKFSTRGKSFEETEKPTEIEIISIRGTKTNKFYYVPNNPANQLNKFLTILCESKTNQSCWCKYKNYDIDYSSDHEHREKSLEYGQINYILQIQPNNVEQHSIFENELIVSICSRKTFDGMREDNTRLKHIKIDDGRTDNTYNPDHIFLGSSMIFPTPVGILCIDKVSQPYNATDRSSLVEPDDITKIFLCDLKPQNIVYR